MPKTLTREEGAMRYKTLEHWAKHEHGYSKVLNWYMCRNLEGYSSTAAAPESAHKDEAVIMSQSSIEDFADELYEIIENELDGVAAFRPNQIETLAEALSGLRNVKAKALVYAFSKIGTIDTRAVIKIDGIATRFHIYSTRKDSYNFEHSARQKIVTSTKDMVNKRLSLG